VSPIDLSRPIAIATTVELDAWLVEHGATDREVVVAIYKRASGRQTVSLGALQEVALCYGWVDTQTKRIDDERYAIRFVPRQAGSNWSPRNRVTARRLREAGRMTDAGLATLPDDL
jgi:uncharacterized protein YdeI (YjbR/CyaY-like superfamily)